MDFALTLVAFVVIMALDWWLLGRYMVAVYTGRTNWLRFAERPIYRALGRVAQGEQTWQRYAASCIVFSALGLLPGYLIKGLPLRFV